MAIPSCISDTKPKKIILDNLSICLARLRQSILFQKHMGVSKNNGTPKSSILIEFSTINDPFWGTPIFGNTHIILQTTRL